MLRQKKQIETKTTIWKKLFFRFYATIAADTGFRSAALQQRKNTTNSKKSKLFKTFYWTVCQLFFNFRTLDRNFLDYWYDFFYSQYFCFTFGRMLQDADVKMYCNFQIFCLVPEIWYFTSEKWPKIPEKIKKLVFVLSKKFAKSFYKYFHKLWVLANIFCAEWMFSNVFIDFSTGFEHTHYVCFDYSAFSVFPLFEFANDASKLLPIPQNMRGEKTFLTIPSWWT